MYDPRFAVSQSSRGFGDNFGQHFPTVDEAHQSFLKRAQFAESVAGRSLSRAELLNGVSRPQPDAAQALTDRQRRERELSPPAPTKKTSAEIQLEFAQQKLLDSLQPAERAVRIAQQKVDTERSEKAKAEALDCLLSLPQAQRALADLDKLADLVRYDSTVDQRTVDEINHQRQLLMTYGDGLAASTNADIIRKNLLAIAQQRADELKSHIDRATERVKALDTGSDWEAPPEFVGDPLIGLNPTVILRARGKTVEVPRQEWATTPKEELLSRHFGDTPNE